MNENENENKITTQIYYLKSILTDKLDIKPNKYKISNKNKTLLAIIHSNYNNNNNIYIIKRYIE